MIFFYRESVGCVIDLAYGRQRYRNILGELLQQIPTAMAEPGVADVVRHLMGEESDDLSEEVEAIDLLNEYACEPSVYLEMVDGCLVCLPVEQDPPSHEPSSWR